MTNKTALGAALLAAAALAACAATGPSARMPGRIDSATRALTRAPTRALTGAPGGGALGYLTNGAKGEEGRRSALIGAGVGALAGGAAGDYMDRQQADFHRALEGSGVAIRRNGDSIVLVMPSDLTFAVDRSEMRPQFRAVLANVARTLNAYPQTTIDVVGHADSSGPEAYNQALSERRASAVAGYLVDAGQVLSDRILVAGMGERQPVVANDTADGRAQNRRVEIILRPIT